ncbi:hypothetical protein Bhyg_07451 [Pseudolycoriella hygida]|uniref:HAT C-terminal dimerisation domain-containing protein n=1 Tax=Pseudolycoriella hygida TaxID=35572 RepID=A0A9Q0N2M3_9DIPT|nr:hypothetical protein Bhyg_07451 [Pseudolycoriella hygida]
MAPTRKKAAKESLGILHTNQEIQKDTLKKMIESNNSSIQLKSFPKNVSRNKNFKIIFVNGSQQDMFLCTECSQLEYVSHGLGNHKCVPPATCSSIKILDVRTLAVSNDEPKPNKIEPLNMAIMKEQLAFSFSEMFPVEDFDNVGLRAMTKYFLNVGATCGNVNATDVLGDDRKLEADRYSLLVLVKNALRNVVAEEKLAFSCDMWKHPLHMKRCITLSSHHIDNSFALQRNVLGTRIYNEADFDGNKILYYILDILNEFTTDPASVLSTATIVTSKTEDFMKSLTSVGRLNCMCTTLNELVNHSLALPCFQTEYVCNAIKLRLERQPPNEKYKTAMSNLQLKDWCSIWYLFEAYQQYLETATMSKNIISGYEILYTFLQESQKASKLLSSNSEATISTVYLVKKKLIEVMRANNNGDLRWPEHKDNLTSFAENVFEITDVHRITLFLDPRYKSLKFVLNEEKETLYATVRKIIGEVFIPDENVKALFNLGDHVRWVDTNGMAEVDNYLNLTNISPDTNVLEFWRLRVDFPKLRTLAKEMLCIPAVSAAWECYFNKEKLNLSRRRLHLSLDEIDSTLLLHGNSSYSFHDMFDEQLKTLFMTRQIKK